MVDQRDLRASKTIITCQRELKKFAKGLLRVMNNEADLELAIRAAQKANQRLKSSTQEQGRIREVIGREWKLEVDEILEIEIFEVLKSESDWAILSEESGQYAGDSQRMWVVDPLDGSANYSREIPFSAISIGLWEDTVPILGVVLEISTGRCFSGITGVGAWVDRVQFNCPRPIGDNAKFGILGTGFPSGFDHSTENLMELMETTRLFGKTRLLGSAAMSLIYVATGRLDSYFEKRIALWDIGAGIPIVQAAGGVCLTGGLDDEFRLDVEAASCPELLASSVKARAASD